MNDVNAVRLLSIDAGTLTGAVSQLLLLQEIMRRLSVDLDVDDPPLPSDHFDMIAGSGLGSWVAATIGILRMTPEEAITQLLALSREVFPCTTSEDYRNDKSYRILTLQRFIECLLESRGIPKDVEMKYFRNQNCKVFLCAYNIANKATCQRLCSYRSRKTWPECTLVEAICASMASDLWFFPATVGKGRKQCNFAAADELHPNPTEELLNEAESQFKAERRVACLLSLGSGRSCPEPAVDLVVAGIERMLRSCDSIASDLARRHRKSDIFHRLCADLSREHTDLMDLNEDTYEVVEVVTTGCMQEKDISDVMNRVVEALMDRTGRATLDQINHSTGMALAAKSIPALSPYFVFREDAWRTMVSTLVTSRVRIPRQPVIFVISGVGGCGKTQMVSYFVREYGGRFSFILFVEAKSDSLIKTDLRDGVRSLGQKCSQMTYEDAKAYLSKLHERQDAPGPQQSNWLIIMDNADNPKLSLADYIPKGDDGTVIITSRNRKLAALAPSAHLDLGIMTEKEALTALLFSSHRVNPTLDLDLDPATLLGAEYESANTLISELGCLPLALIQAGSYCYQMSPSDSPARFYSFEEYLNKFRVQREILMNDLTSESLDNYKLSVYATLDLSYQILSTAARQFLHICAFFSNTMIPEDMFKEAIRAEFEDPPGGIPEFPRSEMAHEVVQDLKTLFKYDGETPDIDRMTLTLQSLSLLSRSKSSLGIWSLNLHPLVSSWARDYFRIERNESPPGAEVIVREVEYRSMATRVLISSLTESYHRRAQGHLLPHVLAMLRDLNGLHVQDLTFLTRQLRRSSLWHEAERIDMLIKNICELTNNSDHPSTIEAYGRLARSYFESERYEPAIPIREMIWETKERLLGQDHPQTLFAKSQVGLTYFRQRRFKEAEEIHSDLVAQNLSLFGPEDSGTINEKLYLFVTLLAQAKLKDAKAIFQQILDVRGDRSDYNLDQLIHRLYVMALAIMDVYNPIRGWTILQQTLPILSETLGRMPDGNDQRIALEIVYLFTERNPDAEEICINIVERESATLGEGNVLMLGARVGIAWAKIVRGDEDAYAAVLEAFRILKRSKTTL